MKITFLGTGTSQGVPVIGSDHPVCHSANSKDKRFRSSILIEVNETVIVVDCGPDFRQQMLRAQVSKIDGLIFTHEHVDHTQGLDDVRQFYYKQGEFHLYADKRVQQSLKERYGYIFKTENKYPGTPDLTVHTIEKDVDFTVDEVMIKPISVWHGKLPILGFRIQNFTYLTDVKTIPESEIAKLQNLDVLVVNALRYEEHHSHFTLQQALDFITLVKPKKAYLTHVSHLLGFHDEVQKVLPKNVFLAFDTLSINL